MSEFTKYYCRDCGQQLEVLENSYGASGKGTYIAPCKHCMDTMCGNCSWVDTKDLMEDTDDDPNAAQELRVKGGGGR